MLTTDEILQNWRDFLIDRPDWSERYDRLRKRWGAGFDAAQRAIARRWDAEFPDRPPTPAEMNYICGDETPWVRRVYPHILHYAGILRPGTAPRDLTADDRRRVAAMIRRTLSGGSAAA